MDKDEIRNDGDESEIGSEIGSETGEISTVNGTINSDAKSTDNSTSRNDGENRRRTRRRNPASSGNPGGNNSTGGNIGVDPTIERKSRSGRRKEKETTSDRVSSTANQACFIMFIVASATKNPELNLTKAEAEKLAEAYIKMAEAYGWEMTIDPRWAAMFTMLVTAGTIFLPKASQIKHRKIEEKKAALIAKQQQEQLNTQNIVTTQTESLSI